MNKIILYITFIVLLFSCKKQEMVGELGNLEGKWRLYAEINNYYGTVSYISSTNNDKKVFYLEFKKDGRIIYYNHFNKVIERGRIKSIFKEPNGFNQLDTNVDLRIVADLKTKNNIEKITYICLYNPAFLPNQLLIGNFTNENNNLSFVLAKL